MGLCSRVCSLQQVFKANGVEKHVPVGEKFDPNLHSALFEIADNSKEAGTIAVVSKVGNPYPPCCSKHEFGWVDGEVFLFRSLILVTT